MSAEERRPQPANEKLRTHGALGTLLSITLSIIKDVGLMLITDVRKMSNVIKSTKQHKSSFRKKNLTKAENF